MKSDIRDIASVDHADIVALNFINTDTKYLFRRHFRQGLRSHIVEVLDPRDVKKELQGEYSDGILRFPRALPRKMLRIFRTRFSSPGEAVNEIRRVKEVERVLTTEFVARSVEMIVEYRGPWGSSPLLCGLQEYVPGVILDPWSYLKPPQLLEVLFDSLSRTGECETVDRRAWCARVREYGCRFVANTRRLIVDHGLVPDLAGVGNVLLTPSGKMKLVDINNISKAIADDTIRLDDRGYPVCDKSIEALYLIEKKLLGLTVDTGDPIYSVFLRAERRKEVDRIERRFLARNDLQ